MQFLNVHLSGFRGLLVCCWCVRILLSVKFRQVTRHLNSPFSVGFGMNASKKNCLFGKEAALGAEKMICSTSVFFPWSNQETRDDGFSAGTKRRSQLQVAWQPCGYWRWILRHLVALVQVGALQLRQWKSIKSTPHPGCNRGKCKFRLGSPSLKM